jgi:hypothetical protein
MSLEIIQNTQVNQIPFTLVHSDEVTYPISPLASVKLITPTDGAPFLSIRVTLYIDSSVTESPRVQPNPAVIDNSLQLYFDYNYTEETPKSLNAWYLELEYASPVVKEITSVTSYLKDIDPETSKGTTTKVED